MEVLTVRGVSKEFLFELESKFFWWEPVGSRPRSEAGILAHAMSMAGFEDVRRLEQSLGCDLLADVMLLAEPVGLTSVPGNSGAAA